MVLMVQYLDDEPEKYTINTIEDLGRYMELTGISPWVLIGAHDLKEAVQQLAQYLSRHHMTAWVEDNETK